MLKDEKSVVGGLTQPDTRPLSSLLSIRQGCCQSLGIGLLSFADCAQISSDSEETEEDLDRPAESDEDDVTLPASHTGMCRDFAAPLLHSLNTCDLAGTRPYVTIGTLGHPNAGKSSLINALTGKKLVSVSKTPGHTKYFQVAPDAISVALYWRIHCLTVSQSHTDDILERTRSAMRLSGSRISCSGHAQAVANPLRPISHRPNTVRGAAHEVWSPPNVVSSLLSVNPIHPFSSWPNVCQSNVSTACCLRITGCM